MGQRTQIILIREDKQGYKKVNVYHHQWGYGRVMYMAFMEMLAHGYTVDSAEYISYKDKYLDAFVIPTGGRNRFKDDTIPEDQSVDINDFESIKTLINNHDNNNGCMVIHVKEVKDKYGLTDIEYQIGFLLGYEEECDEHKAFSEWLTPQQYGELNGGSEYSTPEFVDIFDKFCKYFEVKYFTNKTNDNEQYKRLGH